MKKRPSFQNTCTAIENGLFRTWTHSQQEEALLTKNKHGQTPLHMAAQYGHLRKIPQEVLTEKALLTPDDDGQTPLHWAACFGQLDQIPKSMLTEKNLLTPSRWGETPLHYAARNGHLDKISKEVLTEKALLSSHNWGWTPLHEAAENGHLEKIPIKLRLSTLKDLLQWEKTDEKSKEWLKEEISQRERALVQQAFETPKHAQLDI